MTKKSPDLRAEALVRQFKSTFLMCRLLPDDLDQTNTDNLLDIIQSEIDEQKYDEANLHLIALTDMIISIIES